MSAMPATNLKLKSNEEESFSRVQKTKKNQSKSAKAKVVQIAKARNKAKARYLSAQEREDLIIEYQVKARKMAFSILRRWHARLDLQEVHSIVDLSLCEAMKRFNPNKGASFITFLFYHLRGNLIRGVTTAAKQNVIPLADLDSQFAAAEEGESHSESKSITAVEVAEALSNRECPMPDEILLKKELVRASLEACNKLDKLEREVLFRIYLNEEQLLDVASDLGYSRCHISRVKRKALETLQGSVSHLMEEARVKITEIEDEASDRKAIHRRKPRSGQKSRVKTAARLINRGLDRVQVALTAIAA